MMESEIFRRADAVENVVRDLKGVGVIQPEPEPIPGMPRRPERGARPKRPGKSNLTLEQVLAGQ
jgi:hypothetical protein